MTPGKRVGQASIVELDDAVRGGDGTPVMHPRVPPTAFVMWLRGDSMHRFLALRLMQAIDAEGKASKFPADIFEESRAGTSPFFTLIYIYAVIISWLLLGILAGLVMVAFAYIGSKAEGHAGRTIGLALGAGLGFFCLGGAADATWRSLLVYGDGQRERKGKPVTASRRWLLARPRNTSLLLQCLAGLIAAVVVIRTT